MSMSRVALAAVVLLGIVGGGRPWSLGPVAQRRRGLALPQFQSELLAQQNLGAGRAGETALFAKKKKGPAAAALEALEAMEALEAPTEVEEAPAAPKKQKQKKKKKGGPKGAAAAALAALEDLEAQEAVAAPVEAEAPAAPAPTQGKKKKKKGPKGAAAAALAALEEIEAAEAPAEEEMDPEAELAMLTGSGKKGKKAKKAKKGKKGKKNAEVEIEAEAEAEAEPVPEPVPEPEPVVMEAEEAAAVPEEGAETIEEKVRRTRPPARVRITETSQPGFVSVRLEDVSVVFKNQEVFKDATWEVKTGDRVGLVGPNGGGKTTQLKILSGEVDPTTGEVVKSSKDLRVSFLKQEFTEGLVLTRSLKEEFMSVFEKELRVQEDLEKCENELAEATEDPERMQEILDRLEDLNERARQLSVDSLSAKVDKTLDAVGFTEADRDAPVSSFSGGWKMRIGLGKILLTDPNILLLDEPTNHLDMDSVEWLEDFLRNQNLPMVIVSHDREFLDRVCTKIVDCDGGSTFSYDSNYTKFIKLKKQRMDAWQASYAAQEKKVKAEKDWINRFRAGSNAAQAKSRERQLEKFIASDEYLTRPPFMGRKLNFRFPAPPRCGDEIAVLEDVTHGYNGGILFEDVNIIIDKGDKIAIVGPNGAGKSTLARLLLGREKPNAGEAGITAQNAVVNYFEQNQADALDLDMTVLDCVMEDATAEHSFQTIRALLGQFLFKGDTVNKKIGNLSGGEKARVALCKFMLKPANVLVLDEPTNHLDIPAKEVLEEALQAFSGTVFMISHDRYFISKVATGICAIENKELVPYPGDYRSYMEQNDDIKDKVEARYVKGDRRIESAVERTIEVEDEALKKKKKKNFGGKAPGVSGRTNKGVKNAKRFN